MKLTVPEAKLEGILSIKIALSQITAILVTDTIFDDPYTLKNYIDDSIRTIVDALGYTKGCGYDCEIIQMVDDIGNEPIVFGVGIPVLSAGDDQSISAFTHIVSLYADKRCAYLQRCLSDLREAIRSPKDTGFFCYRAIESLRNYFMVEKQMKTDRKSWGVLRQELGVDRQEIDFIKQFSDPLRHGSTKPITDSERASVLRRTWTIVDKYIEYASNDFQKA